MSDEQHVVVGRVGRAHGIRGDVKVEVRTDAPEVRFALGARLHTLPAERGPLVVAAAQWHSGRLLLRFRGVDDRDAAEALAGTWLVIPQRDAGPAGDDAWWDHELIGLRVEGRDGSVLGEVTDVVHAPTQELLAIRLSNGHEALLPFVRAFVPEVDPGGGRLVAEPPEGWAEV